MSNFYFLQDEWPDIFKDAIRAEAALDSDSRTACFYARRALEVAVRWAFKADAALKLPYDDKLSALIHAPTFREVVGEIVFNKARVINRIGNRAVRETKPVPDASAFVAVRELFHVCYWLAATYSRTAPPDPGLAFDEEEPSTAAAPATKTAEQLQVLEKELHAKDEDLTEALGWVDQLDDELKKLRAEVAAAKKAAEARPDTHDYSEAETRDHLIDLLLHEAGWTLKEKQDREYPVTGMPTKDGENDGPGFVDYVLWGDDGKPLGLVEAKKTAVDPNVGKQQAKLYADCLEKAFGQRPVIFYSNGYKHWMWDDERYPPRAVEGFYRKDEIELIVQRRVSRKSLSSEEINPDIVDRHYQIRAIRRISETFEDDNQRKALLVMATGAGKTRTVAALVDLLMRCNWTKRVLFLADRVALVNQAVNSFKAHLPATTTVNLIDKKDEEGRVYVSTYPTMMGLIDDMHEGERRFGVGHFDVVVVDEAHRSVFQKYRAIFDYFDALFVGLTATPRNEVDKNTYNLFELEPGVPTDAYSLDEAVKDGYLVPFKAVSVPLKFQREGIKYDELSEEEKDEWDAMEWGDDGPPTEIDPAALNKWLFNEDTVDKVLEHVMTRGQRVEGGDRLGKSIVFAKNQAHADFIVERFDKSYPHLRGKAARAITHQVKYGQSLIDDFAAPTKQPDIAVSVDMLDTGIDIPEVANLVFFKLVRSKTKFWQMLGRGTRLRPDLFGPGLDKAFFYVFDYCQNLEFFSQDPDEVEGNIAETLAARLFKARLQLANALGDGEVAEAHGEPMTESEVRAAVAASLYREVAAMNVDNFVVRQHRKRVELYSEPAAWAELSDDEVEGLSHTLAGLPAELDQDPEDAKRFDLLMLKLQLCVLGRRGDFDRLRGQIVHIAGLLEEKASIPAVAKHMELIEEIQSNDWWVDVTIPMLEAVRRRLRDVAGLIDKAQRVVLYSDFEDEIGDEVEIEFEGFDETHNFERFRAKARAFLRAHESHLAVQRLRMNVPLTPTDLEELERMLRESGGNDDDINAALEESRGLGIFVRSLVGLDREAAKRALAQFINGKALTAAQIEFVNMIIDHLAKRGVIDASLLFESPFTDLSSQGPVALFSPGEVEELISALEEVKATAQAS